MQGPVGDNVIVASPCFVEARDFPGACPKPRSANYLSTPL